MLKAQEIVPVLPVNDIKRSKTFYGQTLGMDEVRGSTVDGGADYGMRGQAELHIFPKPGVAASGSTMAMMYVDDFDATVDDLRSRGVELQTFDMPGVTWDEGIATWGNERAVWIKDPDGHLLAIGPPPSS
jgi:catechol 2,3-dioxygenase-like lactoylglutathione lyase family enzyme